MLQEKYCFTSGIFVIENRIRFAQEAGPEVIKLVFMLYSAEHENFSASKYENPNNSWHFHIY